MSKLNTYAVIVKTRDEWAGTVEATSLREAKQQAEQEFNDGNLAQCGEEVAEVIAFKQRKRAGSWRTFERRFGPIDSPDETVWWRREQLPKDVDHRLVWTITESDGRLYVDPGYRFVNRLEYVLCERPWSDEDRSQPGYRYD